VLGLIIAVIEVLSRLEMGALYSTSSPELMALLALPLPQAVFVLRFVPHPAAASKRVGNRKKVETRKVLIGITPA
jgi:hypothetical protein